MHIVGAKGVGGEGGGLHGFRKGILLSPGRRVEESVELSVTAGLRSRVTCVLAREVVRVDPSGNVCGEAQRFKQCEPVATVRQGEDRLRADSGGHGDVAGF